VNDNILAAIRLSPIAKDDNRNFISSWEAPATPITVIVGCEVDGDVSTIIFFKYLHGVVEDMSPAVIREDETVSSRSCLSLSHLRR